MPQCPLYSIRFKTITNFIYIIILSEHMRTVNTCH
nr:MAG TPA: hypothetical protein [Caudoviricetes sp.]